MEEVYYRSAHHGEDFKRCDLMFTPVVNSIMMTCATEESGKRIKSMKFKSNPPKAKGAEEEKDGRNVSIPFAELESKMKRLKQKRCEVKHADKKHNRTNAIPSKATLELKQLLEKSTEDGNGNSPATEILLGLPTKSSSPRPSSSSTGATRKSSPPAKSSPTASIPRPRRPQTSQPSRYLASTRKVQFPQDGGEGSGDPSHPSNPPTGPRKKPLKRDESRGIDDSMLQQSDDSSDDDENEVFDTFNMRGVYRLKKRRALMGASSDRQDPNLKPQQQRPQFRRGLTFVRPQGAEGGGAAAAVALQSVPQYTIPPSVALSEKEAYSAKIATQFLANVLKRKPIASALPEDPNTLTDPGLLVDYCLDLESAVAAEEEIQPELLHHLFPASQRNSSEEDRGDKKHLSHLGHPQPHPPSSPSRPTHKAATKKPVHLLPPPPSLTKSFRRREEAAATGQQQQGRGEVMSEDVLPPPREEPSVWLQKRMKALLAEYQAGEKKSGGSGAVAVDEETRKLFEARTISIEISLLFRGFQTIGTSPPSLPLSALLTALLVDR
jgi:hypothetical protein